MDDAGINFIDKLYRDLYMSDMVQHTKEPSDSRKEAIRKFLERIDKLLKMADTDTKKNHIVNMLANKYVIKSENISGNLPNGFTKDSIIDEQINSLRIWVDYLSSPEADYPVWTKLWVMHGVLKMGSFDPVGEKYNTRTDKTINPFISANPALIAKSIETIMKLVNKEEITDEEEARLSKTKSFNRLYTFFEKKYRENVIEKSDPNDGIWVKYFQGDVAGAIRLSQSVQGTPWCTASKSMAISQVCGNYDGTRLGGDFYVYYTKNKDGEYKIPRIAIRLKGKKEIGEIRGILSGQNLESEMTDIVEKQLKSMHGLTKESISKQLEIIDNSRKLIDIARKCNKGEILTEQELKVLYGDNTGFGWNRSPLANKIIASRNAAEDFNSTNDMKTKFSILQTKKLPANFITDKNFMLEFMKNNEEPYAHGQRYRYLKYISNDLLKDEDFLSQAAKYHTGFLKLISSDKVLELYPNLYKIIKEEPERIGDLPLEFLEENKDLVIKAIKEYSPVYDMLPEEYKKKHLDIATLALKLGAGGAIRYIPREVLDTNKEVLEDAINYGYSFKTIGEDNMRNNPQMIINGFKHRNWGTLDGIPTDMMVNYPEIVTYALKEDGKSLRYVPKEILESQPNVVLTALSSVWFENKYEPSIKFKLRELEKMDKSGLIMSIIDSHPEYIYRAEIIRTLRNVNTKNLIASIHRLKHVVGLKEDLAFEQGYSKTK